MLTSTPLQSSASRSVEPNRRWLGVEVRHLATLRAVREEGSFRRAAERLGYVPSAVSQQITALESAIGDQLVDRAPGGGQLTLTPVGELLVRHAATILTRLSAAQADLSALIGDERAGVRLGLQPGFPEGLLSALVRRFIDATAVHLHPVEVASPSELYDMVRRGELDAAFGELPLDDGPFGHRELLTESFVLAVLANERFPRVPDEPIVEQLLALPLILPAASPLPLDSATCRRLEAAAVAHADSPASAVAFVRAGVGAAIVGSTGVSGDGLRTIDLTHLVPPRRIALIWHGERRQLQAIKTLEDIAVDLCLDDAPSATWTPQLVAA